jgi:hypothetical protein
LVWIGALVGRWLPRGRAFDGGPGRPRLSTARWLVASGWVGARHAVSGPRARWTVVGQARSRDREPSGELARLWAGARAAQHAAAAIATRPGVDDDLRFSTAAGHCGEAADELHRIHPDIAQVVDIPALSARLESLPTRQATSRLLAAVTNCISGFDFDDPRLRPVDMLAAGPAANWLAMAHHAISGRLP